MVIIFLTLLAFALSEVAAFVSLILMLVGVIPSTPERYEAAIVWLVAVAGLLFVALETICDRS